MGHDCYKVPRFRCRCLSRTETRLAIPGESIAFRRDIAGTECIPLLTLHATDFGRSLRSLEGFSVESSFDMEDGTRGGKLRAVVGMFHAQSEAFL